MNAGEELTKLLVESYDRGVNDAKQEALIALEKVVAVAVAAEREACAKVCDDLPPPDGYNMTEISFWDVTSLECAAAIRARGQA
jgi:hypothetical protein